jgi:hypothetical protein
LPELDLPELEPEPDAAEPEVPEPELPPELPDVPWAAWLCDADEDADCASAAPGSA